MRNYSLYFLSNFIWSVKISGTEEISNTYLESLLGDNGISVGVWKTISIQIR